MYTVCVYIYIYVMYIDVCMYVCIYVCMYICMYIYMHCCPYIKHLVQDPPLPDSSPSRLLLLALQSFSRQFQVPIGKSSTEIDMDQPEVPFGFLRICRKRGSSDICFNGISCKVVPPQSYKWAIIPLTIDIYIYIYISPTKTIVIGLIGTNLAVPNWGTTLWYLSMNEPMQFLVMSFWSEHGDFTHPISVGISGS